MEREGGNAGRRECRLIASHPFGADVRGRVKAEAMTAIRVVPGNGKGPRALTFAAAAETSDPFKKVYERRNDLDVKTP